MSPSQAPSDGALVAASLQSIGESIGDAVVAADTDSRITLFSPVAARLTGWSVDEAIGRPLGEVVHVVRGGDQKPDDSGVRRALEEGVVVGLVNAATLIARDGTARFIDTSYAPVRDEAGAVAGVVLILRDRTDERRAQEALRASEARYRAIVEQAAVGIAVVETASGRMLEVNAKLAAMLGRSREEMRNVPWKDVTHPDDWHLGPARLPGLDVHRDPFQVEKRYLHKDGSIVWARVTVSPTALFGAAVSTHVTLVEDITARRRADDALREKESQLRHALEAAAAGVWLWDLTTNENVWSDEMWSLYALDRRLYKASYEAWRHSIHPDDRESVEASIGAAVAAGNEIEAEWRVNSPAAPPRWLMSRGQPQRDAAGRVVAYRGIVIDITARKVAESELRTSEARYRSLFANIVNGFAFCRMLFEDQRPTDFIYLSVNKAFEKLTGLLNVEGKKVSEVIPGIREADPELFERYARVARTGQPERFELYVAALGMWFDLSVYSPEPDHFVAVFDVITARKQAEAERERLMAAIEQAGELVVITSRDGRIVYVNPAFESITGYSRAEAIGKNPRLLKSGKHDSAFYAELWGTILGGRPWRGRLINRRKRGDLYTEEATVSPVCDAAGNIVNFVAVGRDITDRIRLEEQLRASQKIEAIGHLAGGVAHDFNNLLSAILSYTEFVLERVPQGDPLRHDVEEIMRAGERGAALTRQLLAFGRKQLLEPKVVELNQIVLALEKMLRRLIGEHIELKLSLAPNLRRIKADPGQIEQVIMNLVVNARDAMVSGGKFTIETANVDVDEMYTAGHVGAALGPHVLLAVSDNGTGMDASTRERVFEPFFTTKEMGKGTGLGLSTVYGIVKQSGGNIEVYSELGHGTTFKVYLPELAGEFESVARKPDSERHPMGSETILLVEDDEAVRQVATRVLRAAGYQVLAAANGGEALRKCKQHGGVIHLLVTDVVMPEMSGIELAERLADLRPRLPVVFMSGYTDNAIDQHGVLDAGTNFIGKPFTSAGLTRKVQEALLRASDG